MTGCEREPKAPRFLLTLAESSRLRGGRGRSRLGCCGRGPGLSGAVPWSRAFQSPGAELARCPAARPGGPCALPPATGSGRPPRGGDSRRGRLPAAGARAAPENGRSARARTALGLPADPAPPGCGRGFEKWLCGSGVSGAVGGRVRLGFSRCPLRQRPPNSPLSSCLLLHLPHLRHCCVSLFSLARPLKF